VKKKSTLLINIEYLIVLFLIKFISLFPYKIASDIGGSIGRLGYYIDGKHRNITLNNLTMAFPEKGKREIIFIARKAFENLGRSVAEVIYITNRKTDDLKKVLYEWITVEGRDNLDHAIKKGKGILLLTAHFGNWELLGLTAATHGYKLNVIARPLDNPKLDTFINSLRSITGTNVYPKKGVLKDILKSLKQGEGVGILIDQNTSRSEGVFVDFFGQPASTNRGPAVIAMKSETPVVPFFIIRENKYRHRIVYCEEIPLHRSGDKEKDAVLNTKMFTKKVESFIRNYPEQWFWMHQRWKTRPLK